MSQDQWTSHKGRKRILALDSGGVRGVFTLAILARMEELLREHYGKPQLVLADHFQFIAGTSTGAIIATLLSWGLPVETLRTLYHERCHEIFPRLFTWKIWKLARLVRALYGTEALSRFLKEFFHDDETGQPALLGTRKLKTILLVCMLNASTGSAWPITNNPKAKYNERHRANCNLNIPLWQLVRASTAAPVYFLPEQIRFGEASFAFQDGAVTPYNSPALISYLMATLPCYGLEWPTGADRLLVVSIGTGLFRSIVKSSSLLHSNIAVDLMEMLAGLMEGVSVQQDFLCRVMGRCLFGQPIDKEAGDLISGEAPAEAKKFSYVRYDHSFTEDELAFAAGSCGGLAINNVRAIPFLSALGERYAGENVRIEHLI
ncbi:MAG TPA: patatin-like phospholipase family protein [Candidatus Methylacidiphilales bacterium]